MAEDNKNIFAKMLDVGSAMLDAQLAKARSIAEGKAKEDVENFNFGKAVTRDLNHYIGSQGYQEKAGMLTFEYQRQMALKSSVVGAIVKTRQNRVAAHSEYVPEGNKKGFRIVLKKEADELEKIKEELFGAEEEIQEDPVGDSENVEGQMDDAGEEIAKAEGETPDDFEGEQFDPADLGPAVGAEDPQPKMTDADKTRQAKKELEKRTKKKKDAIADFLLHCGELKDRPFESKRWNFDSLLRALVWDSLVYDQIAIELIPKNAAKLKGKLNIHHIQPVDGSTIRFASPELVKYKTADLNISQDILYPEEELKALEARDALELDEERLENHEYKYVQVIRGRIQRAFTEDELKIGMRNPITDIYANSYSISELELLVTLITSHLQTEFYNRAYFQQGFSAKGILHVKANLNRSKLEELRRQWNHMVKGNRNSFQTPIMAGMDEVSWIPLTQSHSEMEFTMWLNYLIRMICSIYQIDPAEIGYGMKDEGGRGGGLSGDNTTEKLQNSKDKGLVPLMKFMQNYLNSSIIDHLDPDYMLEWVGLEEESEGARIERQEKEGKFKKSVNEIRAEDGLPPIPGADHLILDPTYFQWYSTMSEEGKALQKEQQQSQMQQMMMQGGPEGDAEEGADKPDPQQEWDANEAAKENDHARNLEGKMMDAELAPKPMAKSLRVEYYRIGK